jgi:hypothetical protein
MSGDFVGGFIGTGDGSCFAQEKPKKSPIKNETFFIAGVVLEFSSQQN